MNPFIPAWLDDLGLSQAEFRVLCKLWRHADKVGICFPGTEYIWKQCLMSENTLWKVLKSLESKKLIERRKREGNANTYRVHVPTVTAKETVTHGVESPQKERQQSPQSDGSQSPQSRGLESPQKERHKGTPLKVPHKRYPSEGVSTPTQIHGWPSVVPLPVNTGIAEELGMTIDGVAIAYADFRQRKLTYRDSPPSDFADIWEPFKGWLKSSKNGKELRAKHSRKASTATNPNGDLEPQNWKQAVQGHPTLGRYENWNWGGICGYDQKLIRGHLLEWSAGNTRQDIEGATQNLPEGDRHP